jgi:hypothetical protein
MKPIHDQLLRHLVRVMATTIDAIAQEQWIEENGVVAFLEHPTMASADRAIVADNRRAKIGMGLHWLRRKRWAEITMIRHADGLHPYWRLTPLGRAACRRRGIRRKKADKQE